MRGLLPGPAEVGGDAEADERPQPGPVHCNRPVGRAACRVQAVGPVVPNPLIDQAAARVAAVIGERRGDVEAQAVDLEVQGVAPLDDGLSGAGGIAAAFSGAAAFAGAVQPPARAVRPGRIQLVVRGPGRVPGVPVAEAALDAQETDPRQFLGLLEGTVGRRSDLQVNGSNFTTSGLGCPRRFEGGSSGS